MSRRRTTRRSSSEWMARSAIAATVAIVGGFAVTFSLAQVVAGRNPALAYNLASYDGRITARYAAALTRDGSSAADQQRSDALARHALLQDPMAVTALSVLGFNADLRGDRIAAQRMFSRAQTMSRRDVRTQLWMIEYAVGQNDIPEALDQYDMTLRVFPSLGALLYPILAQASDDPDIRRELVKTLARRTSWSESFISYAGRSGSDPRVTATLFSDLRRAGVNVPPTARATVVDALIASGQTEAAWQYYAADRPGADRQRSRDIDFAAALDSPSQFDWVPTNGEGIATSISDGTFDFTVPASVGGTLLRQVQLLPPGDYRLSGRNELDDQASAALPYWTLACQNGRELGRITLVSSVGAKGQFSGSFRVPTGCPVQTLMLVTQPSEAIAGLTGRIDRIELSPVSR